MYSAPLDQWIGVFEAGRLQAQLDHYYGGDSVALWQGRYAEVLREFARHYGGDGDVVIARCPGQMNIMGMHIDYGGMPSIRLSVRGADTITIARANQSGRVRMHSAIEVAGEPADKFAPLEFDLEDIVPAENVGTRQALMDYAGEVCSQREAQTGNALTDDWAILVQGQLIFLESYFRGCQKMRGFDALVWSNVSPSGGMSSSSALVTSTAYAALGVHGLQPGLDMPEEDLVDGIGTSEWIRGTRGGTADHGGMVMGRAHSLVSVGVFPARACGRASLPADYVAVILDSKVPRVYDEAVKEETVIAYPLGTFMIRDMFLPRCGGKPDFEHLFGDFKERIVFIRDITEKNLGIGLPGIYRLLGDLPEKITLKELEERAREAGAGEAYKAMWRRDIGGKFQRITPDYPILLRRRFAFGLAEQDRVEKMLEYMNDGNMETALELVRISHDGDRDQEVSGAQLEALQQGARRGDGRVGLCFLAGGYGRMTPEYDRVVRQINQFLLDEGGADAGALQRLGAGWGGNVGGLVKREFVLGDKRQAFSRLLNHELGIQDDLDACVATPGEGACLFGAPGA
jgi:galactokinase